MTMQTPGRRVKEMDVDHFEQNKDYKKILELEFGEMIPFVLEQIRRRSFISLLYVGINLGLLICFLYVLISGLTTGETTWSRIFGQSIGGIVTGSFLIVPIHELIHGFAYKLLGARKIYFGADMQQFIFYVTVDRYPVSRRQLYFLAMLPFALINMAAVLILFLWAPQHSLFVLLLLLSHNIMCIGDFAVVNFVYHVPGKVYSYDVVSEKKSYFFSREIRVDQGD